LLPAVAITRETPGFHNPAGDPCRAANFLGPALGDNAAFEVIHDADLKLME
jgi:hypothetical protein